jgi:hypothetical protein
MIADSGLLLRTVTHQGSGGVSVVTIALNVVTIALSVVTITLSVVTISLSVVGGCWTCRRLLDI